MASCDLCGKPATTKARVEGAVLSVCASCASLGTEIREQQARAPTKQKQAVPELYFVGDAGQRVRQARQRMKLTEKEAAQKLGMKENMLLHIESGKFQPDDATARKLEKFFNIHLLESA